MTGIAEKTRRARSSSLRNLEVALRVKVLLLITSGNLLLVFHFRTKLDKKGRPGRGLNGLPNQASGVEGCVMRRTGM